MDGLCGKKDTQETQLLSGLIEREEKDENS